MSPESVLAALPVDPADPLVQAVGGAVALLLLLLALAVIRAGRAARTAARLAAQVEALAHAQSRSAGAQAQAVQAVEARLADVSERMGESLSGAAARTAHSLGELQERLAAIDRAQANIEKLSGDVLGLQDILSNKQTRGAFGEIQLHDILSKALPPDAFRWQATLANGKRADCVIDLPPPTGPLAIDAKFPLESYEALRAAATEAERKEAARAFRTAVRGHIRAIAEKYVVPGETADGALMFLPSEAVYAELHARFGDVVREGFAARVWIVSPTTCMAVLNTLRAVLKDARMREQAGAIRATLGLLHRDVEQVVERVGKLQTHLAQAQGDLDGIGTAAHRAMGRAAKLENFELDTTAPDEPQRKGVTILRP
ncbi:DNA recombination protein RmuC [Rhodovulum sp. 12E13]|uniref:DNA recombination protein RmuC n=1 Tax=Rhodovulum sp. 12E13 TaxID=2203891 RepID=UPI000E120C87|nr:DNA recombination protein RmuC [Rhodovulum sp. 12E13]RDC74900.1 DNA recombination protein RmuC [Rhodovulum sp. 12E13]